MNLPGSGVADNGLYVGIGILAGILLGDNKVIGPWVLGILTVALVYQTNALLQHKYLPVD